MATISCGDFKTSYAKDMAIFDSAFARWSLALFLLALLTLPLFGGGVKEVAPFVILVAILMIKPYGLFGKVHIERV